MRRAATSARVHQFLLFLGQKLEIDLLPQTSDECGGLSGTRRPEDRKTAVEREAENFILEFVENWLVAQLHRREDGPA